MFLTCRSLLEHRASCTRCSQHRLLSCWHRRLLPIQFGSICADGPLFERGLTPLRRLKFDTRSTERREFFYFDNRVNWNRVGLTFERAMLRGANVIPRCGVTLENGYNWAVDRLLGGIPNRNRAALTLLIKFQNINSSLDRGLPLSVSSDHGSYRIDAHHHPDHWIKAQKTACSPPPAERLWSQLGFVSKNGT